MRKIFYAMTAVVMLGLSGCGSAQEPEVTGTETAPVAVHEDLVIPVSEVTGTAMEVFAVKDTSGNIRTAFNTCQSCYTSGNGRYEVEGTDLVCQNCGFHFTADQVGEGANGGCSPWAISAGERTDSEDSITIPYEFLVSSKNIFANWR